MWEQRIIFLVYYDLKRIQTYSIILALDWLQYIIKQHSSKKMHIPKKLSRRVII